MLIFRALLTNRAMAFFVQTVDACRDFCISNLEGCLIYAFDADNSYKRDGNTNCYLYVQDFAELRSAASGTGSTMTDLYGLDCTSTTSATGTSTSTDAATTSTSPSLTSTSTEAATTPTPTSSCHARALFMGVEIEQSFDTADTDGSAAACKILCQSMEGCKTFAFGPRPGSFDCFTYSIPFAEIYIYHPPVPLRNGLYTLVVYSVDCEVQEVASSTLETATPTPSLTSTINTAAADTPTSDPLICGATSSFSGEVCFEAHLTRSSDSGAAGCKAACSSTIGCLAFAIVSNTDPEVSSYCVTYSNSVAGLGALGGPSNINAKLYDLDCSLTPVESPASTSSGATDTATPTPTAGPICGVTADYGDPLAVQATIGPVSSTAPADPATCQAACAARGPDCRAFAIVYINGAYVKQYFCTTYRNSVADFGTLLPPSPDFHAELFDADCPPLSQPGSPTTSATVTPEPTATSAPAQPICSLALDASSPAADNAFDYAPAMSETECPAVCSRSQGRCPAYAHSASMLLCFSYEESVAAILANAGPPTTANTITVRAANCVASAQEPLVDYPTVAESDNGTTPQLQGPHRYGYVVEARPRYVDPTGPAGGVPTASSYAECRDLCDSGDCSFFTFRHRQALRNCYIYRGNINSQQMQADPNADSGRRT